MNSRVKKQQAKKIETVKQSEALERRSSQREKNSIYIQSGNIAKICLHIRFKEHFVVVWTTGGKFQDDFRFWFDCF